MSTTMEEAQAKTSSGISLVLKDLKEAAKEVHYDLFSSWYGTPASPTEGEPFQLWGGSQDVEQNSYARTFLLQNDQEEQEPAFIVWRKEYERIRTSIEAAYNRRANGVVIAGQPGIGKTWFLIWLCRLYLGLKRQFCLYMGETLWIFSTQKDKLVVYYVDGSLGGMVLQNLGGGIPILIDMGSAKTEPPVRLTSNFTFPIQVSSPDNIRSKTWSKQKELVISLIMDTWPKPELLLAFKCRGIRPEKSLETYLSRFGPVLQKILGAVKDWDSACSIQDERLSQNAEDVDSLIAAFGSVMENHSRLSPDSVVLIRSIHGSPGQPDKAYSTFVSPYVANYTKVVCNGMDLRQAISLYRLLEPHSKTAASASWVFEAITHLLLPQSYNPSITLSFRVPVLFLSLPTQEKQNDFFPHIETKPLPISFEHVDKLRSCFISLFSEPPSIAVNSPVHARYLMPTQSNNAPFDAIVVTAQRANQKLFVDVWVLQVDTRQIRDGSEQGLPLLKNVLAAITTSPSFSTNTPVPTFRYVYVTPQAKISKQFVWHPAGLPSELEGPLYYLPICWDKEARRLIFPESMEVTDDEIADADGVELGVAFAEDPGVPVVQPGSAATVPEATRVLAGKKRAIQDVEMATIDGDDDPGPSKGPRLEK